ncbi:transferrin-binding protein-like solute binding protein [Sulfurospirillum cavolei]|uniref:transferrin-binding protein-like solute binding protein n=1 Tax=Sulfurospirillum cavolei TaxID=366522 RepID=UPI003FA1C729
MKYKNIVFSMVAIGFLVQSLAYADETESTSNDYYSNYGPLSLNTNALNTALGTSLQNEIATIAPTPMERTVAAKFSNLQQPANVVTLDASAVRNSLNQEVVASAPTVTPPQSNYDTSYAGEFAFSWEGDRVKTGPLNTTPDGAAPKAGVSLICDDGTTRETKVLTQSKANYFGDYNYVAWGTWDSTFGAIAGGIPYKAFWVASELTIIETQPKTGTATYKGEVQGILSGTDPLGGTIGLNANFGTNALTGNMKVTRSDGSTWRYVTFNTSITTAADGEHMQFATQLNGTNIVTGTNTAKDSKIIGDFAGPQAAEAGGIWNITSTNGNVAVGAFRAKKQ